MSEQNEKDLGTGPGSKTVAIDFDGVIHSYTSGWTGPRPCDSPVPGAYEAIVAYLEHGFEVAVYSTRAETPEGRAEIIDYLLKHFGLNASREDGLLRVVAGKPIAVVYIDDRGFQFRGQFPSPEEVAVFEPWKMTP